MQNIKVEITGGTPEEHEAIKAVLSDVFAAEDSNPTPDEAKAIAAESDLRPEELALPERVADPHNMSFTDEELDALTATDNEAAKALAFATAGPEKRQLLKAKETE